MGVLEKPKHKKIIMKRINLNISVSLQNFIFGTCIVGLFLLYLYCREDELSQNTVITIWGSGIAAFIGAYTAFFLEKNERKKQNK